MPIVTVEFLPGRNKEIKQRLAQAITNAMVNSSGDIRRQLGYRWRSPVLGGLRGALKAYSQRVGKK